MGIYRKSNPGHMGIYGPIWVHMGPYGPIWVHIDPYGPYGPIWAHPPGQMSIIISAEIRRRGKFEKIEMADRKIQEK